MSGGGIVPTSLVFRHSSCDASWSTSLEPGGKKRKGDPVDGPNAEGARLRIVKDADVVAVDDALSSLAAFDKLKGDIVELRFFGGLTVDETAEVLGISASTVQREWRLARAWLRSELSCTQ